MRSQIATAFFINLLVHLKMSQGLSTFISNFKIHVRYKG